MGTHMLRRFSKRVLRWRHLIIGLLSFSAPLTLMILGLIWLWEKALLLEFALLCLVLSALALAMRLINRNSHYSQSPVDSQDLEVQANAEWSEKEKKVFYATCADIQQRTQTILPWEDLPEQCLQVIRDVADNFGNKRKKPLDFSGPEALLLIELTASRYRKHLRDKLPFADQIKLSSMYWLWQKRNKLGAAIKIADGGRRLLRFITNPTVGAIYEAEKLIAGDNSSYLSEQMLSTLQTLLLEEVASAAIDLYSGRLQFSDAELRAIELKTARIDQDNVAVADKPLRILMIGQISSGKSSLINHLINKDHAETDLTATTEALSSYPSTVAESPCYIVDTPGIDATAANQAFLLQQIADCDLVIWTLRADRPSRAADKKLIQAVEQWFAEHPQRRRPPVIYTLTFIDRILSNWPYVEHAIPPQARQQIDAVQKAVCTELQINSALALSNEFPAWNVEALIDTLKLNHLPAIMVQKNRLRIGATEQSKSLLKNTQRGAQGIVHSVRALGSTWLAKNKPNKSHKQNRD